MRIRSQLLIVAAIVFVPGFLAAVMAVQKVREGERRAALDGLRETVRASALLVDGAVQRSVGAMTALAQSDHLRTGNLKAFYEAATATNQPHVWTLLFDESGTQVLNTAVPFGTPPPPPTGAPRVSQALASGRLFAADLATGPVSRKLVTTLYLPTREWNGKRYVVAQAFSVDHWKDTALQVKNGSLATVAVIDGNGRFISRNINAERLVGQPARPELVAAAAASPEGLIRHTTLEGTEVYDAFTHSELTGWTVAVAMPVDVIEASASQAVRWLAASGVLALVAAIAAAALLGRAFIRVIEVSSRAARSVGRGEAPELEPSSLVEVKQLYEALADAGRSIASEKHSRETAEAQRRELLVRETALREAAQKENAAKDQFLALLGHELRNPLAAISGATAVLGHSRTTPEAKERFLAIIQRQNKHLSHIVNDLLDVSRLMSGKITLDTTRVNLAQCVSSCIDALRATDKAAGHRIEFEADDVWVQADPVRVEQIVNNLVFNSLKSSQPGTAIRVAVKDAGKQAVLSVTDEGVGIGQELMPHIFDPFVQGPPAHGRMTTGLGIGLALVKQLVALHGGEVRAESAGEGCGATFMVALPKGPAREDHVPPDGERRLTPRRVLLVEDDRDAMAATAEVLQLMGHQVLQARDHTEALATAARERVDVVVMDIGLPGRDGYEIAAEMRRIPSMRDVSLIALTGYGQEADRVRAWSAGFDEHLTKPVDTELLAQAIEQLPSRPLPASATAGALRH